MKAGRCKECKEDASKGYNVGVDRYCDRCFERWMRQSSESYQKMVVDSLSTSHWQHIYKSRKREKRRCKRK